MKLTPERMIELRDPDKWSAQDSLDALDTIDALTAERDVVARGQALRDAAAEAEDQDKIPMSKGIAKRILALSPDAIRRAEEHDQRTREKYRADLIVEGWIGPVQAEQVVAKARRDEASKWIQYTSDRHIAQNWAANRIKELAALPASGPEQVFKDKLND
jgi:hypothetical protein